MIEFRYIPSRPHDPYTNMAIDEAISRAVKKGHVPPTFRFYTWRQPSISIGYFQKPEEDLDLALLDKDHIPWVRRMTGGRAIFHHRELTYSLSAPTLLLSDASSPGPEAPVPFFPKGIRETYRKISMGLLFALRKLDLPVSAFTGGILDSRPLNKRKKQTPNPLCFSDPSWHEIMIGGKKVVGSAQKRTRNGFIQQGSILLSHQFEDFRSYFKLNGPSSPDCVGISDYLKKEVDPESLEALIVAAFEEIWGIKMSRGGMTPEEEDLAEKLLEEKYRRKEWNLYRKI
ncbi:MAG TPA: biotin/lipoate A/B protein ligase family protein [Nitrospiria bacterium]|nr:biotin/lipoate A/B protein ligase family protein [Nitrospiria bacterium]